MEDTSSSTLWINLGIVVVALLLAILFTLSEYALVRTRKSLLVTEQEKQEKPSRNIKIAIHMTDNLTEYLSTAQVGITITSLLIGWVGESSIAQLLINTGLFGSANSIQAHTLASVIALILFTYIHAVFSDLLPKNIALDIPLKTTLFIARPLRFFHLLFYPLVWIMDRSSSWLTKVLGFSVSSDDEVLSQGELLNVSQTAAEAGEIDEENVDFIKRAFAMSEKKVNDIMVDRTSLVTIDVESTIEQAADLYFKEQYSRIPVTAAGDKDKILGYVYNYDIMRQLQIDPQGQIAPIMRDIVSVPENMEVYDALNEMSQKHVPLAVAIDEFGGTAGLISDKDIYEELFGQFEDEQADNDDEVIQKLGNEKYLVSGKTSLYDFEEYFDVQIPEFKDEDSVTLTGFVLSRDANFRTDSEMEIANFNIKALDYEDAYISEFEVTRLKTPDDPLEKGK